VEGDEGRRTGYCALAGDEHHGVDGREESEGSGSENG
jgi:hypothetical protein